MNEKKYWKNKWEKRSNEPINNFAKKSFAIINDKNFKTLLDLGSGDGRDSVFFASKGFRVTAVDFSESGISRLKLIGNRNIKAIRKDIRKINFPKNSFNVIYAHLSLHYFNDKETTKIFKELFEILKTGGYLFVKCKSTDDKLFGKGIKVGENMYKKSHIRHFFTKKYMKKKLARFKILKISKTSFVYQEYKSSFIEAIATK